ncbi:MAG: NAD(P)/FAD-dependent oxidoreductase [Calditrichaeota bacterium]|nr:FAD-dependent oxidoreductase [Calditrichota bacterium]RQV93548.1 MAG: NAD(P)/FAD-dependent oxidoreductase [bacterium]RQW06481.1 MAG: NAD(P)/FAD-dependent oxidoreductase [Calditrichota bacterium]
MKKWRCKICGYIHHGETPPDICPVCDAGAEDFKELETFFIETDRKKPESIIIIGNGAAGMEAARAIRENNQSVQITVFAKEHYPFYSRIHLSTFIGNEMSPDQIEIFPASWYPENNIQVITGTAVRNIQVRKKIIKTDKRKKYSFDKLIITTGAIPYLPPVNGLNKKGVFSLRNLDDALLIRDYAQSSNSAIVIGGGILGIESASSLNKRGLSVTVFEQQDQLLPLQLDKSGAFFLQKVLEKRGIQFHLNSSVSAFTGRKKMEGVEAGGLDTIPADMALISAGIVPDITLAREAGLTVNRGIVVNNRMETSHSDIYAAGDAAEFEGKLAGIWPAAVDQGLVAGLSALGLETNYNGTTPLHILKVSGIELTTIGKKYADKTDEHEMVITDSDQGTYVKLVHNRRILLGAIALGVRGIGFRLEKTIKRQQPIDKILPELVRGNWEVLKIR